MPRVNRATAGPSIRNMIAIASGGLVRTFFAPLLVFGLIGHAKAAGPTLPFQTIAFGAKTLAGFGETAAGSTTGKLTGITASTCGANSFAINGTGKLVPYGPYGAAGPLIAQSCSLTLTNGIDTANDTVIISPGVWTISPRPASDTASSNQLATVFSSAMTLGDTIQCRDGSFNYNATLAAGQRYILKTPPKQSNGYPWAGTYSPSNQSGRITIVSEHTYSGTNARGNPVVGGGCQMAYITPSLPNGVDIEVPVDFINVNFRADLSLSGPAYTQPLLQLLPGMRVVNSTFSAGFNVTNAAVIVLANYSYTGVLMPGDGVIVNGSNITLYGNELFNGKFVNVNGGATSYPHAVIVSNVIHDMWEKGLSIEDRGAPLITDNLLYNVHAQGSVHSDSIIMNTRSYVAGGAVLQGATLLRNIIIHGHDNTTIDALNTGALASGICSKLSNTTYLQQPVTGGSGSYGYLDVTVTGAPSKCSFSAVRTPASSPAGYSAFYGGMTQPGGEGYQIGDVVTVALGGTGPVMATGVSVKFNVSGLTVNADSIGIFQLDGTDSSTGVAIQNNIVELAFGDTIVDSNGTTLGAGASLVNYNDAANDWQHASAAYGAQNGIIYPTGANIDASYNITNTYNMATATGASACLPGLLTDSPACQGVENTTRLPNTSYNLTAYRAVWTNYDTTAAYKTGCVDVGHCYNRANAILNHAPAPGGRGQVSGTLYATALCPMDNAGVVYWNTGVCDATATHAPAQ